MPIVTTASCRCANIDYSGGCLGKVKAFGLALHKPLDEGHQGRDGVSGLVVRALTQNARGVGLNPPGAILFMAILMFNRILLYSYFFRSCWVFWEKCQTKLDWTKENILCFTERYTSQEHTGLVCITLGNLVTG